MAKQTVNLGTAPTGVDGDTNRSAATKFQANDNEIYSFLGDGSVLPSALAVAKGGTGATTLNAARTNLGVDRLVLQGVNNTLLLSPNGQLMINLQDHDMTLWNEVLYKGYVIRTGLNTTVDGNGFVKAASPIVQLFADHIELNDDAEKQEITFTKNSTGDYLVSGSLGFAQEGWYVEMPKDANGNVLVAVVYQQLPNNDISVKTYKKKFDLETASIVADLDSPIDIPVGRWIDLRLEGLPVEPTQEGTPNEPNE